MGDGTFGNQWAFVEDGSTTRGVDEDFDVSTDPADTLPEEQPGPSRATLWVPVTERTLVNLGSAYTGSPAAPALDAGIAGRTLRHVHFHTMGPALSGEEEASRTHDVSQRTAIRLGIPSVHAAASPDLGHQESLFSVAPEKHNAWVGYSMVTAGGAVQESRHNHVMLADLGDLRLAGGRSVSIGSPGDVLIAVHSGADVAELVANTGSQQDPTAAGPGKIHREITNRILDIDTAIAGGISWAYNIMESETGYNRVPKDYQSGWESASFFDFFGTTVGMLLAAGLGGLRLIDPALDTPGGRLDLFSSNSVSIAGQTTATLRGLGLTSVSSIGLTSIGAEGILALSGGGASTYSATALKISGMAMAGLEAKKGPLTLLAGGALKMTSRTRVQLAANEEVQINSMENQIWLFGKQGFYLACGGGARLNPGVRSDEINYNEDEGFAVVGLPTGVKMGKVLAANHYGADQARAAPHTERFPQSPDDDRFIEVTRDVVRLKRGATQVLLDSSGCHMTPDCNANHKVSLSNGETKLTGDRIQLG